MKTPLLALFLSLPLAAEELPSIALMKSAADSFLGTLDESKRGKAVFPFDGDQRENFKFSRSRLLRWTFERFERVAVRRSRDLSS